MDERHTIAQKLIIEQLSLEKDYDYYWAKFGKVERNSENDKLILGIERNQCAKVVHKW